MSNSSVTPWTVAHQAPLFIAFPRKEYWSGLPFPSLGDLPNPGIEPGSPTLQADFLLSEPPGKPEGSLGVPLCYYPPHSLVIAKLIIQGDHHTAVDLRPWWPIKANQNLSL